MPSTVWAVLLCATLFPLATARAATVSSLVLPARTISPAIEAKLSRIAAKVAGRLSATLIPASDRSLDLHERFVRARALMAKGAFDEAAALLDGALEQAVHAPQTLRSIPDFVAAHVRRAAIGLARGETGLARSLLARLRRYDPTFALLADENSPPIAAALADVTKQFGARPALEAADLGESCRASDVLIIARPVAIDAAGALELIRFDDCHQVAKVIDAGDEEKSVAALSQVALASAPPGKEHRPASRTKLIVGPIVAALGAALLATGIYYSVRANPSAQDFSHDCMPCTAADLQSRGDALNDFRVAAGLLVPIAAAALASGVALSIVGVKERRAVQVALAPGGALVTW